jgi:hypothetical protein
MFENESKKISTDYFGDIKPDNIMQELNDISVLENFV